ncbi:hypothetical protein DL766_005834 [Monosporascus sp. MC13-8B]|uniref:Copper transport protein n=1 Tax=Monosporascus cannonballus TaxID=155416 RepID=A0ABY0H3A6_9PEZI|nr:hypothetical protein DL762_006003 [Monosporascus cannonballus]RYO91127.1 hypothetical protein DL763_005075 [Monosporascus cannonballus]RYP28482.1 hypothetical protein DL766_005834 [Monosporascus sp. MC13-8B]
MNHGSHSDIGGEAGCKVDMLWNWYTIDACFLTRSWRIQNQGMMAATCIGVILMVICLEFLRRLGKEYDDLIQRQFQRHVAAQSTTMPSPSDNSCAGLPAAEPQIVLYRASPLQQVIRSIIHAATFGLAYIIMLLAMYFNGYIIISIFIGAGIGKFLCDWMVVKVVLNNEQGGKGATGIEETTVCCG